MNDDSQILATLEVGPKSSLVIYELCPTRRRKTIAVAISSEQKDSVAFVFSNDGKLLATLLPDGPTGSSVCIYMWRTGKIVATVNLASPTLPTFIPQVQFNSIHYYFDLINFFFFLIKLIIIIILGGELKRT